MGRGKVLDRLLRPAATIESAQWWNAHAALFCEDASIQAVAAGMHAPSVGYAFAGGYQCALRAMFGVRECATLAITEETGAHPKQIATRYHDGVLDGVKTFATLAPWASCAFVLARGEEGLVMARVSPVQAEPLPPLPFAPEIPHGVLRLVARPAERLPGDGYSRYTKPFRTVEDIYVHLALVGFAMWKVERREPLLAHATTLAALAEEDPLAPAVHLALAGVLPALREAIEPIVPERDRPLLRVAEAVRARRTDVAWATLRSPPG